MRNRTEIESGYVGASGYPIKWLAAAVGNRENPKHVCSHYIRNVIGKDPQVDAAIFAKSQPVKQRVVSDPQNVPVNFVLETFPQTDPSFFVIGDGIEKLLLRLLDKPDGHGTSRFSAARMTSS